MISEKKYNNNFSELSNPKHYYYKNKEEKTLKYF